MNFKKMMGLALFFMGFFSLSSLWAVRNMIFGPETFSYLLTKPGSFAFLCNPLSQGMVGKEYQVNCKVEDVIAGKDLDTGAALQKGSTYLLRFPVPQINSPTALFTLPHQFVVGRLELVFLETGSSRFYSFIGGEAQGRFNVWAHSDGKIMVGNGLNNLNIFNAKGAATNSYIQQMRVQSEKDQKGWVSFDELKQLLQSQMKNFQEGR